MRNLKEVTGNDGTGFIFWCIFLIVVILEASNASQVADWIVEAYQYGLVIDFVLMIIVAVGLPSAFGLLTYNIWFKK